MGDRSIQPSGSPTGAPGSRPTSEETKQSERAKNQLTGSFLGPGISNSTHDGKRSSRSPVERAIDTPNFWERTDSYDEEIGNLFDDLPEISNTTKQQQDTGPGVHDKQQQSKFPKVIKKNQRARVAKINKNETAQPELIEKFHRAAASGNMEEVRQMLLEGIDVSMVDLENHDVTALHLAARSGEEEVIRLLLHWKADLDCRDGGGKTPLYWAAKQGNASTVEYLLQMNAGRDIRTVTGWTGKFDSVSLVTRTMVFVIFHSKVAQNCVDYIPNHIARSILTLRSFAYRSSRWE